MKTSLALALPWVVTFYVRRVCSLLQLFYVASARGVTGWKKLFFRDDAAVVVGAGREGETWKYGLDNLHHKKQGQAQWRRVQEVSCHATWRVRARKEGRADSASSLLLLFRSITCTAFAAAVDAFFRVAAAFGLRFRA